MNRKVLMTASVASMIDLFNMDNIHILKNMGYEVHVAANFEFGNITSRQRVEEFRQELENEEIETFHVPIPRSIFDLPNIVKSCRQLNRLCAKHQYAMVHTQSPIGGVVARLAARKYRKYGMRVIYTAHGFHFYQGAPKKNWLLFYPIEYYFSRFTDDLITINQEDYKIAQKFHKSRVHYVPGIGVDIQKFSKVEIDKKKKRYELGLCENDFVVLSVGQLSKRKNQETIIEAMSLIPNTKIKYLIVGQGELDEAFRKKIHDLNLEERVILAGYRGDINELLHIADCFAFPSLQEGLPASLMEAMAARVPVVCSKIRGNIDLVEDGVEGRLLETGDVMGYANAIMRLQQNPKMAEMLEEAEGKKIENFSRRKVMECMTDIYDDSIRTI